MYKGNGVAKTFPLPPGADGHSVFWVTESSSIPLREGEAYSLEGGGVVFEAPPPVGVTVAFSEPAALPAARTGLTVIYPDGRVAIVADDPALLLAEAKTGLGEARRLLKEAKAESERTEILCHSCVDLAKEKLSARLEKYSELVDDSVRQAAALARDEVNDHVGQKLLEIRKKHKEAVSALASMEELLRGARAENALAAREAAASVRAECASAVAAAEKTEAIFIEMKSLLGEAKAASGAAAADIVNAFGAMAGAELEALRATREAMAGEMKSYAEAAMRSIDSGVDEIKRHRGEMERSIRHMNRIERDALGARERTVSGHAGN
jgi:hypothetical protein